MKIAVDLSCLSESWAGCQYFTYNFTRVLSIVHEGPLELLHYNDSRDKPALVSEAHRYRDMKPLFASRVLREQIHIPLELMMLQNVDRLLVPAYLGPVFVNCAVDLVVYDLLFLREDSGLSYKQRCYWEGLYERSFNNANRLFPCSQHTRNQLIQKFPNLESKTGPPLYPSSRIFKHASMDENCSNFNKSFILCVGTISPRKNIQSLINWYEQSRPRVRENHDLRIVGKYGWGEPTKKQLKNAGAGIHWHGSVSDSQLKTFYQEARILCFPSLGEGFGLPILEAFKNRLPVVLSDINIFREVAGTAAFYIDPDGRGSWDSIIESALFDDLKRKEKITRGVRRQRKFSWAQSVIKYLKTVSEPS